MKKVIGIFSILIASNLMFALPTMEQTKANIQNITQQEKDKIEKGYIRIHLKNIGSDKIENNGLWLWGGVEKASTNWPTGATKITKKDAYGWYVDIKKSKKIEDIGFLVLNGDKKITEKDQKIPVKNEKINEVWLDEDFNVNMVEPLKEKNVMRVYYYRSDNDYKNKSLWFWNDTEESLTKWPDGKDFDQIGKYGHYVDIKLKPNASKLGLLLLDESKKGDDVKIVKKDIIFDNVKNYKQIFLRDDDASVYTNPYFISDVRMIGANHISENEMQLKFTSLKAVQKEEILKNLLIKDKNNNTISIEDIIIEPETKLVKVRAKFPISESPYQVKYANDEIDTIIGWQLKDSLYSYDGVLGSEILKQGKEVKLHLWAPSAENVNVLIFDKNNQDKLVAKFKLEKKQRGVFETTLKANKLIKNYTDYYYQYEVERNNDKFICLDPYAKALGLWDKSKNEPIAKGVFLDPNKIGLQNLNFAKIKNYDKREDAIIYEVHVRDFTSDKNLKLKAPYGTFKAFIEKLDYIKSLGVTHIQLLPILSYYNIDESKRNLRSYDYLQKDTNYNWGYDPQNYFSLTGMYSINPKNPEERIKEFKELVNEIHKRGMGVILDVVYNHTAKASIFDDIEPNYYYFMDENGNTKTNFGGGRLGTTHYMSRRILLDSIKYLMNEYKVDGFRFDMMGDHDAKTIEMAYNEAKKINKNVLMLGEGWRTYEGDTNIKVQPADQTWMKDTNSVAVFSDDIRNKLKSGFPNEGTPAFLTGKKSNIQELFSNIKAQPTNFVADEPGDVIQYAEAHDNLTLFDVIVKSTKLDPSIAKDYKEIIKRVKLGNFIILTSQGTPFLHAGQEFGRTKQIMVDVPKDKVPEKATFVEGIKYPYFIHDSYNAPDAINKFDWERMKNSEIVPYTRGLIQLRRNIESFRLKSKEEIDKKLKLLTENKEDLLLAYEINDGKAHYLVIVNADSKDRLVYYSNVDKAKVLVDANKVDINGIKNVEGLKINKNSILIKPLTATILKF